MRSPSSRRANTWTAIQTGLHRVMSSRAVLAQDLGDGLSPDLKGMRAAKLRQISPDSPKRQLLVLRRAEPSFFFHLPKSACPLSSPRHVGCAVGFSNVHLIWNTACEAAISITDAQTTLVDSMTDHTRPHCCRLACLRIAWAQHVRVWTRPPHRNRPRPASGSNPSFCVLLSSKLSK